MTLKMVGFIVLVTFIVGSLALALWYRMNEDSKDE
tara:strand:+ start:1662 stop:1766 length:105 start_codon:yes stop_codon:yes gene_type:complete